MQTRALACYLNELLDLTQFDKDGSNNGLQIEASETVKKVGFAVDACQQLFDVAIADDCDFLFVHHGLSWGDNLKRITGIEAQRIGSLFKNEISLYAAHLPLDAHPVLGHNAVMAHDLGLNDIEPFAEYAGNEIGYYGEFDDALSLDELITRINTAVDTSCHFIAADSSVQIKSLGIVSGGAADCLKDAYELGLDAFLTGEYVHQHYHSCLEYGIPLIAGGHYKTECPGVKAVMDTVASHLGLETVFYDIPTDL